MKSMKLIFSISAIMLLSYQLKAGWEWEKRGDMKFKEISSGLGINKTDGQVYRWEGSKWEITKIQTPTVEQTKNKTVTKTQEAKPVKLKTLYTEGLTGVWALDEHDEAWELKFKMEIKAAETAMEMKDTDPLDE